MLLLARTTPKEQAQKRTDGLSVFLVDMREAADNGPDDPADPHHDEPRHHRGVLRPTCEVPAENLIGEEGKGFRYILSGMNAERILIAAECIGDAKWFIAKADATTPRSASCSAARSARTRASSFRSPRPTRRCARPN